MLLWLDDEEEALSGPGRGMFLPERANGKTASPFGIIVKGSEQTHYGKIDNICPHKTTGADKDRKNTLRVLIYPGKNINNIERTGLMTIVNFAGQNSWRPKDRIY